MLNIRFQFLDRNSVDLDTPEEKLALVAFAVSIPRSEFCGFRLFRIPEGLQARCCFNSSIGILWI